MADCKIIPVILAGGVGTRLWPLSREASPKQFLRLVSQHSLLQETLLRLKGLENISNPVILCNSDHYFMCLDHLREINVDSPQFILEPFGRNTAPIIAVAAKYIQEQVKEPSILLVLPSDHLLGEPEIFFATVLQALTSAQQGALVTFGVVPKTPETGYGYIEASDLIAENIYQVKRFIEKPRRELAEQFVNSGHFYWNSGMFMFHPQSYLDELKKFSPDIYYPAIESYLRSEKKADYIRLNSDIFATCPNISIDYAVMEKTQKAAVIPLRSSWSDLGCWNSVAKAGIADAENNVIQGQVITKDTENCYLSSDGRMIAALGLKNQIVVSTADAVLVADKAYAQEVKHLVNQIKEKKNPLASHHPGAEIKITVEELI